IRAIINDPALDIAVVDDVGTPVGTMVATADGNTMSRPFPLLFADPVVTRARSSAQLPQWRILVRVRDDGRLLAARGANRTLALLAVTGLIAVVALALTLRSARAADKLAALQAEFVSAMSHEMKTPLSLITLASGTLASGRYTSTDTIREYAKMVAGEADQLRRLIDNVLCYARLHDVSAPALTHTIDVIEIAEEAGDRLQPPVNAIRLHVRIEPPLDAPPVRGDRALLQHAIENLIDNAVKHGESG